MLGGTLHQRIARLGIIGIDELLGAECGSTFLTLVAISLRSMAAGTLSADVAVGKETSRLLIVELLAHLFHKLTLIIEFAEEIAGKLMVYVARGATVDIKGYTETAETLLDELMIAVHHLLNANTLLACTNGDRHSMLITATHEYHLTSLQAKVTHIYVGRHIHTSQMTDMYRTIGIGQSCCDCCSFEILFHTDFLICAKVLFSPVIGCSRGLLFVTRDTSAAREKNPFTSPYPHAHLPPCLSLMGEHLLARAMTSGHLPIASTPPWPSSSRLLLRWALLQAVQPRHEHGHAHAFPSSEQWWHHPGSGWHHAQGQHQAKPRQRLFLAR